jgi:hypothetical protein
MPESKGVSLWGFWKLGASNETEAKGWNSGMLEQDKRALTCRSDIRDLMVRRGYGFRYSLYLVVHANLKEFDFSLLEVRLEGTPVNSRLAYLDLLPAYNVASCQICVEQQSVCHAKLVMSKTILYKPYSPFLVRLETDYFSASSSCRLW